MQTRLTYYEALALALADVRRLCSEHIALHQARGRIAASDDQAPFDLPGFANSAMDGFALRAVDLAVAATEGLPLRATILAGDLDRYCLEPGTTMAIMTGAPMPQGADTVVTHEQARREADRVWLPADARAGGNVRAADDDCAIGTQVLAAGDVLTPARLAVLASFGMTQVEVVRRPRVTILTTGDELIAADQSLGHGQRYNSNGPLLAGLLADAGAEVLTVRHCDDDPARLARELAALCAPDVDLLVTCGGVSAGEADHLPSTIATLGEVQFWKLRMKPGMPALFGRIGSTRVFALPGNPVSVGVTFQVLVRPLLDRMLGRVARRSMQVRLATAWSKPHPRLEFLRVTLAQDEGGAWLATPLAHQGSGALSKLAVADALLRLDDGIREYQPGDLLQAQWLPGASP